MKTSEYDYAVRVNVFGEDSYIMGDQWVDEKEATATYEQLAGCLLTRLVTYTLVRRHGRQGAVEVVPYV